MLVEKTDSAPASHAANLRNIMKDSQNCSDALDVASEQDMMLTAANVMEVASRNSHRTPGESAQVKEEIACTGPRCGGMVELARLKLVKTTLCCACAAAGSTRAKQFGRY